MKEAAKTTYRHVRQPDLDLGIKRFLVTSCVTTTVVVFRSMTCDSIMTLPANSAACLAVSWVLLSWLRWSALPDGVL